MFDKNGQRTIEPLNKDLAFLVGTNVGLSFYDVLTVHKLYNCAGRKLIRLSTDVAQLIINHTEIEIIYYHQ